MLMALNLRQICAPRRAKTTKWEQQRRWRESVEDSVNRFLPWKLGTLQNTWSVLVSPGSLSLASSKALIAAYNLYFVA